MKNVESYWIEELPNGVFHLCLNLKQKGCFYHDYDFYTFLIAATEDEYERGEKDCILTLEPFLPTMVRTSIITTSVLEKNQLSFYYIPYKWDWVKSKNKRLIKEIEI